MTSNNAKRRRTDIVRQGYEKEALASFACGRLIGSDHVLGAYVRTGCPLYRRGGHELILGVSPSMIDPRDPRWTWNEDDGAIATTLPFESVKTFRLTLPSLESVTVEEVSSYFGDVPGEDRNLCVVVRCRQGHHTFCVWTLLSKAGVTWTWTHASAFTMSDSLAEVLSVIPLSLERGVEGAGYLSNWFPPSEYLIGGGYLTLTVILIRCSKTLQESRCSLIKLPIRKSTPYLLSTIGVMNPSSETLSESDVSSSASSLKVVDIAARAVGQDDIQGLVERDGEFYFGSLQYNPDRNEMACHPDRTLAPLPAWHAIHRATSIDLLSKSSDHILYQLGALGQPDDYCLLSRHTGELTPIFPQTPGLEGASLWDDLITCAGRACINGQWVSVPVNHLLITRGVTASMDPTGFTFRAMKQLERPGPLPLPKKLLLEGDFEYPYSMISDETNFRVVAKVTSGSSEDMVDKFRAAIRRDLLRNLALAQDQIADEYRAKVVEMMNTSSLNSDTNFPFVKMVASAPTDWGLGIAWMLEEPSEAHRALTVQRMLSVAPESEALRKCLNDLVDIIAPEAASCRLPRNSSPPRKTCDSMSPEIIHLLLLRLMDLRQPQTQQIHGLIRTIEDGGMEFDSRAERILGSSLIEIGRRMHHYRGGVVGLAEQWKFWRQYFLQIPEEAERQAMELITTSPYRIHTLPPEERPHLLATYARKVIFPTDHCVKLSRLRQTLMMLTWAGLYRLVEEISCLFGFIVGDLPSELIPPFSAYVMDLKVQMDLPNKNRQALRHRLFELAFRLERTKERTMHSLGMPSGEDSQINECDLNPRYLRPRLLDVDILCMDKPLPIPVHSQSLVLRGHLEEV